MFKRLIGLGLRALATDEKTTPEELTEAAAEAVKQREEPPIPAEDPDDRRADYRRTPKPAEEPDYKRAEDARTGDRRAKLHAALDRMLAGEPEDEPLPAERREPVAAEDVDLDELRELLAQFFEEEEGEPEHREGQEQGEEPEPVPEPVAAADRDCSMTSMPRTRVGDQFIEPIDGYGMPGDALDALNALRPVVARSKDAAVIRAFNGQLARFSRSAAPSDGGYAAFADAARHRAADVRPEPGQGESDRNTRLQAAYDERRAGKKEVR